MLENLKAPIETEFAESVAKWKHPLFRFILGCLITAVLLMLVQERDQSSSSQAAAETSSLFSEDIHVYMEVLAETMVGFRSSFEVSGPQSLDSEEFRNYVEASRVRERFPAVQAVQWSRIVEPSESTGEGTVSVEFGEPAVGELAGSEPIWVNDPASLETLKVARDTADPVLSPPVQIRQGGNQFGLLLALQVEGEQASEPNRFVVAIIAVDELLSQINTEHNLSFVVSDLGTNDRRGNSMVLYRSRPSVEPDGESRTLPLVNRVWELSVQHEAPLSWARPSMLLVLAIGVFATGWSVLLARRSGWAATRADFRFDELTEELAVSNEALRQSEDRLQQSARAAKVGLWEYDYETDVMWVSDQLAFQLGTDPSRWTSWGDFVDRLHPADANDYLSKPTPTAFGEMVELSFRMKHDDGSYREIRARSVTLGEGDVPTRKVGAHIDVSDNELVLVNKALVESNDRLAEFTRLASHDLRSPLRAITSLVGFLKEDAAGQLDETALDHLDRIKGRSERMNRLLDGLLDYANASDRYATSSEVDLAELLSETAAMVDTLGCLVVINAAPGSRVTIPIPPFQSCIRNLVDNACKHHHREGGLVEVDASIVSDSLEVTVSDDGPGVPYEYQAQIFEPFRSLKSSDEVEGSGIGLSVVRVAVEAHGGSITIRSAPDKGSVFHIRWPLGQEIAPDEGKEVNGTDRHSEHIGR